ncbi:MAG: alpha-ribazole phosphatase [Armatimonadetes bacterium]|nr:alpha-ribazole phosphatase [Armatimonadota bacterium]NIM23137.1 alpha-ribazole phosphatase [Armatimonadota bacterium]NIM67005.1 alpha-ribazole phosphatase [Armatimonadota bacterium]NIM75539.1 alpha-ribazole phosphatase [Armatimonadota bacterium]NIN05194.1 alpha-ribazole phosphatase [Armatimonadota bacterium]
MQKKQTLLFFVRHGETEWNQKHRYQGQTDVPLNAKGRRQSRSTARRLAKLTFHAAYSSDLKRASQCAEIIAAPHKLQVKKLPALRERDFGELEGLTRAQAQRRSWWQSFEKSDAGMAPPAGESRYHLHRRVLKCMDQIIASHHGQNVLIVTHGGPIARMISAVLGMPTTRRAAMRLDNCSINLISIEGEQRRVLLLNDTAHIFPKAVIGTLAAAEDKAT